MKILITGSNGLLGQKLLALLRGRKDLDVAATSRRPDQSPAKGNYTFDLLDITDRPQVSSCLAKHRPEAVIHTAAMTNVDPCELNKEKCWKINVAGTENLVRECEKYQTHFVHLSTDFVFDGQAGPYREDDPPNPLSQYGQSKLASEKIVRESKTPWAILRTMLVYGVTPRLARSNIVLLVKNNLEKKQRIRIVNDQFRMPTLAEDLAGACLQTVDRKAQGVFHISGEELVSIYEFSKIIADVFGLEAGLIDPVATPVLQEPAKRPPKTGFILDKAKKVLGYRPHRLREGLEIVRGQIAESLV